MNRVSDQDYHQQVNEFRRDYLNRILIFLGGMIWLVGSVAMLVESTSQTLAIFLTFEVLCLACFFLGRQNRLAWAGRLFVLGVIVWAGTLAILAREPLLLILLIAIAPICAALLSLTETVILTVLLVSGELAILVILFPETWHGWLAAILPLATVAAVVLARLREIDFETILAWSRNSTRAAQERLAEVREHRAKLFRNVKDLDDANHRLERTNEMLVDARAEAERARQARDQFALTVSHELRTPLGFIIGFSEVMVNSPEVYADLTTWPPGLYADIEDIYRSSRHLLNLVNDVLDLGKADSNRLMLIKEPIAPEAIVDESTTIMSDAIAAKNLWLKVDVAPGLPELFIDRTRIRQVLINLINNALRFTEQGGITIQVNQHEESIVFCVRDSGPGIPENEVPKVFEEFGQANATVWRRRDGSGLGVPISQRFVEMHGGRMWLESQVGKGSDFFFSLPLTASVAWPRWISEPEKDNYWQLKIADNRSSRLLIVLSPDPGAGTIFEDLLQGYQVMAVTHPEEAQRLVERLLPRGIIVDQGMAGREEVQALLDNPPYDLPVLVLALPGSLAKMDALPEGVVDYLPKPVLRDDLLAALERLGKPVRRLMVVDDEETMLRFVSLALHSIAGMETIEIQTAASAAGAMAQLDLKNINGKAGSLPDAILLDLGLPDMNGWELLDLLKRDFTAQNQPVPPVILFTAATLQEELESRQRKTIQVSTRRTLSAEELGQAVQGLLEAIHPHFTPDPGDPGQPKNPSARSAF